MRAANIGGWLRGRVQVSTRAALVLALSLAGVTFTQANLSAAAIGVYGTGLCAGANAADSSILGDCSGGLLATTGINDNNWTLVSVPGGTSGGITGNNSTATEPPVSGHYVVSDLASQSSVWINPTGGYSSPGNSPPLWYQDGTYEYQETFNLTGFQAATASLVLALAADNLFSVQIDGTTVFQSSNVPCSGDGGPNPNCYANFSAVQTITNGSIAGGFHAGTNTIDIFITNTSPGGATCADNTTPCSPTALRVELTGTAAPNAPTVPEPSTWGMLSAGLAGLAFLRRRRLFGGTRV